MGDDVTALDTFKRLITFQPGPVALSAKSVTDMPDVFGPMGQRAADWSGIAENPALSRSYRLCATAYACTTLLADAVTEAPLKVYRIDKGDLIEQPEHRLRKLLTNPNPAMSESELMGVTVMAMGMFGYGVIEKVRSGGGVPVELWPVRPDWLKRERNNDGTGKWVLRKPGQDPRIVRDEDLIFIPYRHDERQIQIGVSPLQIVAREIGIDVALTDLLKVFLDAGGIPPWAVELGDTTPKQADIDTFREQWSQKYGGWQAYQNIGILYGGMKLVKVGDSIGDMAWPDLRGLVEMKIAQAFRVPADLIQARDSMNSGSLTTTEAEGSMATLQMFGATPLRQRIDGAFTRALLPDFVGSDPSYTIEFDTSDIYSLQEDRNQLHDRVRADFDAGAITLNQYLNETGRAEIGTPGEVYKVAFTTMYVPLKDLVSTSEPAAQPIKSMAHWHPFTDAAWRERYPNTPNAKGLRYVDLKSLTDAETKARANYIAQTNRNRQKLTEIGTRKLRTFFKQQGERVVGALKSDADLDIKATPINWDHEDDLLKELMDRYYSEIGKSAFGQVSAFTGAELAWDVANPNVSRVMDQMGTMIKDISEGTRADVAKIISDGLAEGMGYQELGKELSGLFEETYKSRAETIARTESMTGYSRASVLGYEESGSVDECELVDNRDHTDPYDASDGLTCAERDGLRVALADVEKHIEAEHPNGSLAVIPILNRTLGE